MPRYPAVYLLANHTNTVLYIGVTGDLSKRIWGHRQRLEEGFTSKYRVYKLVYYECLETMEEAIEREKQLKRWSRKKKEALIDGLNPKWEDLYQEILSDW